MKAIDIIKPAVPGFGHYRQAPPVTGLIGCPVLNAPGNDCVARYTDAVRIGHNDWSFQEAALFHPRRACHFAVAIQAEEARVNWVIERSMPTRQDSGHAGAHRTFADLKFAFAADQGGVTNFDTGYVSDRVKFSRRALKWNSEIASANNFIFNERCGWQMLLRFACGGLQHE